MEAVTPGLHGPRDKIDFFDNSAEDRDLFVQAQKDFSMRLADARSNGVEEGRTEGKAEERIASVAEILGFRFQTSPQNSIPLLEGRSLDDLARLKKIAFDCASYEDFLAALN